MAYAIELAPTARRYLSKLSQPLRRRISRAIEALAEDPRAPTASKLRGVKELHRVRVGDYGIVYQIREEVLLVLVVRIGHRTDVYRKV